MRFPKPACLCGLLVMLAACDDAGEAGPTDVAADSQTDAGQNDGDLAPDLEPQPAPWEGCPTAADWEGDASWPHELLVTNDATYCGLANEGFVDWENGSIRWADQRAYRGQIWLPAGSYRLPAEDGTYSMRLPVCTRFHEAEESPVQEAAGTLEVRNDTFDVTYRSYTLTQPLTGPDGTPWELQLRANGRAPDSGSPEPLLTLDGAPFLVFSEEPGALSLSVSLCSPDCTNGPEWRSIDSCHFDRYDTRRHSVAFEGGEVELDLRYGESMASTEPGQFVRAAGTLDGTSFEATDYWDLVYTPEHHHFARHFMVLLDPPIGDACALAAEGLDENADQFGPQPALKLFDCDLQQLETRDVTSDEFERLPAAP